MSLPHQRALVCNDRAFSNSPFFVQNPLTSRKNSARIVKLAFEEKRKIMNWNEYTLGVRRGMPVGMGYLSVSFGFGTLAASQGIRVLDAFLISATNVTSAGQFAGLTLILAGTGLWEVILTQLIINSRYALMSLALSQRMGEKIGFFPRLFIAFMNTDEIFALAMSRKEPLTVPFLLGLGLLPFLGWTAGTVLGGLAGSILPEAIRTALGIMLYGMFIAIVVPPAKKERPVLVAVILALVCSCLLDRVPVFQNISAGIAIVICTVLAAGVCAALFPISEEEAEEAV